MNARARIGIGVVALAIAGGLLFGFYPRPVPVDIVRVDRGPIQVTFEEEGKTRVRERYVVSAPTSGYVRRIEAEVGDAIAAGQLLATIEPARSSALDPRSSAQAAARVKAAAAAVDAAVENGRAVQAQYDLARQEMERSEALRASNFVSGQVLDRARSELARSEAARRAADHATDVARFELEVARAALAAASGTATPSATETVGVHAPVAGRVLRRMRESEGAVQAGEALLEIGDPRSLEVEVEVLSPQAVRIAPGADVLFDRWGGERPLQGKVRVVEPTAFTKVSALGVEEQRVRVIVDFTSAPAAWQRIGDGYRVDARFVVWEGEGLRIPAGALFRHGAGWAVFVVEAGRATLRPVETGHRAAAVTEVVAGLAAGESVVDHPDDRIGEGIRVAARDR